MQTDRIMRSFYRAVEGRLKKTMLDITADLIEVTPVDTGWAASNWVPSIGDPVTSPAGSKDNIDRTGQDLGVAEVAISYTIDQGPIWISNNVPYIESLNKGSSPQASAGFVERIINSRVREANEARLT